MARKLLVEIVGDTTGLERSFSKASRSTSGFTRDVNKAGRGALSATGAFRSLGRSVAFASGAFLGGAGLISVMKASVSAAEDLHVAQERLRTVVNNLGLAYDAHAKKIDSALSAEEKLSAFTKQDLTDSFGKLIPATKSVSLGLRDVSLAADVARARHMDLQAATLLVVKAQEGQVGALRRMGIAIDPVKTAENALTDSHEHFTTATKAAAKALDLHATGLRAVTALTNTYGGSAKNATTPLQKFQDETHQLEVVIGGALLPELNKLLAKFTPLIQNFIDSGRAAKDTKQAIHDVGIAAHAAFSIFKDGAEIFRGFADVVGGDKHAIELLTAAFVAFKLKGVGSLVLGVGTAVKSLAGLTAAEEGAAAAGAGILGPAALAIGGAAAIGYSIYKDAQQTQSFAIPGSSNKHVELKNGQFAEVTHSAGKGASAFKRKTITPAQAAALTGNASLGMTGSGGPGDVMGRAPGGAGGGPQSARAFIAQEAIRYRLDPKAVLGVASHEGLSGGIGDNGHAFGPFQLNNAGGVITGMFPGKTNAQIQAWAWSPAGIDWALKHMAASGAAGLTGGSAVKAIVGNFERPKNPAGDLSAGYSAVGGGGGSSPASIAALLAQGTTKAKKAKIISGAALLPARMQIALSRAFGTTGLTDDQTALTSAIANLKGQTQTPVVAKELSSLQKKLHEVDKQIAANLKKKEDAIKSSFKSTISTEKSGINSAVSRLKSTLDQQFQRATQQYIDTVLGPQFFQGTDATGMQLQTPSEVQLAAMQAQDQLQSLQDAISQATTPADKSAAQRQLDEYQLSIKATKERAQADHDYAAAVQQYQDDRTALEQKLNDTLDKFGSGLADGTTKLSDLQGAVSEFGVSLTANDGIVSDFSILQDAVKVLALTMASEAQKLLGVGDTKDAKAIQKIVNRISGGVQSSGGTLTAIPMADGGIGRATRPTLFFSKGNEDFAFSGEGKSFGSSGGGSGNTYQFSFPNYVGSRQELASVLRGELVKIGRREPDIFGGFA